MSLWGKRDILSFGANISVTNNSITVTTAGSFGVGGNNEIHSGELIRISGVNYRVANVASNTSLTLTSQYTGATATVTAANVFRRPIPKFWLSEFDSAPDTIYFVDATEASLSQNKNRGLTTPGWWRYFEYTTEDGDTRYKSECLVTIAEPIAADDDTDDPRVGDAINTITISAQPVNVTGASTPYTEGNAFSVTASVTNSGTLSYQWQYQTPNGTRWTNATIAVFTTPTTSELGLTGATKAIYNGYKFRVKITSNNGAPEVISNSATLTYA